MCSNEKLALLYQETPDKKNKEKIFNRIYKSLEKEAFDVCHFYKNCLNFLTNKDLFFEDAMQEARLCLVKCIEKFDINKNTQLSTFYQICLTNHLSDFYKNFANIGRSEIIDTNAFEWSGDNYSDEEIINDIDKKILKSILSKKIQELEYSKPIHKSIFINYIGFNEENLKKESFASLGAKYGLTRMAIKKIVDKYFKLLKESLQKSGDMDKIQQYL